MDEYCLFMAKLIACILMTGLVGAAICFMLGLMVVAFGAALDLFSD